MLKGVRDDGRVGCPVYLVILADGRSLDTDDYDRAVALMHEHPDAEWWCVDSFPAEDAAPKSLGGRALREVES